MFTLELTPQQKSWLITELNMELRHCDPRGYPNNDSYVLHEPFAGFLNDLFVKLTGQEHGSYTKWIRNAVSDTRGDTETVGEDSTGN